MDEVDVGFLVRNHYSVVAERVRVYSEILITDHVYNSFRLCIIQRRSW